MSLAVTALLGFLFIQTRIANLIPKSESVPYLAIYVLGALLNSVYNLAGLAIVLMVYNKPAEKKVPKLLAFIGIRVLGILMLYKIPLNLKKLYFIFQCKEQATQKLEMVCVPSIENVDRENSKRNRGD